MRSTRILSFRARSWSSHRVLSPERFASAANDRNTIGDKDSRRERPGHAEPEEIVPVLRGVPAADRRAQAPRVVDPGTATQHAPAAISAPPVIVQTARTAIPDDAIDLFISGASPAAGLARLFKSETSDMSPTPDRKVRENLGLSSSGQP